MTTKKEIAEAAAQATVAAGKVVTEKISEISADLVSERAGPMARLAAMASEYQTVNVKIFRVDEQNPTKKPSLFTEVNDHPLSDVAGLEPYTLCRREGGGGLWNVLYVSPDLRSKPVEVKAVRTEGRVQAIGTSDAERDGVDKYTGQPKPGAIPALPLATAVPAANPADLAVRMAENTQKAVESERKSTADIIGMMFGQRAQDDTKATLAEIRDLLRHQYAQQATPVQGEETRLLRQQLDEMRQNMAAIREQQAKAEADARYAALQSEIKALNEKLASTHKNTEVKLLEAKIDKLADKPAIDPTISLLTTVLGSTREDAKSQMALVLELMKNQPDTTDKFAKIQDLLMQSAVSYMNLAQQAAQNQGGPSHPLVEAARMVAETASAYFGSRGEAEEEEVEEAQAAIGALPTAGSEKPKRLAAPAKPQAVPDEPEAEADGEQPENEEEGMEAEISPQQIREEIQAQVQKWMAGEEIPAVDPQTGEKILLSEKELDQALASSSLDTAIRVLVSKKKPIAEVTARIQAVADGGHPLAEHWLMHPLPATYQILAHWQKKNGQNATARIADLATDIFSHWAWVQAGNDPYGRSTYRPPSAAKGVETHIHGMATQGKRPDTAFGKKQNGENGAAQDQEGE